MSDRKSVDRLFQEKFKEFEAAPPENSWDQIRERLPQKRRKNPLILWWTAAAGIALMLSIPLWNNGSDTHSVVQTKDTQIPEAPTHTITGISGSDDPTPIANPLKEAETQKANSKAKFNQIKPETLQASWASHANRTEETQKNTHNLSAKSDTDNIPNATNGPTSLSMAENRSQNQPERRTGLTAPVSPTGTEASTQQKLASPNEAVASQSTDTVNANAVVVSPGKLPNEKEVTASVPQGETNLNRWQVHSRAAPVFMNAHGAGSALDMTLAETDKDYKTTMSVGIGVSYDLGSRWTVRTGVNALRLEYETRDLMFMQTREPQSLQHGDMNAAGSMLNIGPNTPETAGMQISSSSKFNGNLSHRTSYIEWPVELSYSVLDKRFGIDIIGGASALFLQKNDLVLVGDQTQISIGRANNLNRTHFSTNLGIGLRYEIFKKMALSVEPTLKYQFNTYKTDVDFNPYFFGIYSGLQYRF